MSQAIDVLINGAGVGGALTAYYLAKQGLEVVVVEQQSQRSVINGADLLKPSGIKVLKSLGLLDEILEKGGQKRHELKVFHNGEPVTFLDYREFDDLGYFILGPYEVLRNILWDKLSKMDNVTIHYGTRIDSVYADGDVVNEVVLENAEQYAPKIVVGADGSGSFMRHWLSIKVDRRLYPQKMYLGCFPMVPSVKELNRLYVDEKQGLAYFYPISKDQFRLVVGFPGDEARELMGDKTGAALKARLAEFVTESDDALEAINTTRDFKGIPIAHMHSDEYGRGNVVLLGNAIHNAHPITGQGMNLAIEDAGELGQCLEAYFNGDISREEAFKRYFENRYKINDGVAAYGHSLATTFHSRQAFSDSLNLNLQGSGRKEHLFNEIKNAAAV